MILSRNKAHKRKQRLSWQHIRIYNLLLVYSCNHRGAELLLDFNNVLIHINMQRHAYIRTNMHIWCVHIYKQKLWIETNIYIYMCWQENKSRHIRNRRQYSTPIMMSTTTDIASTPRGSIKICRLKSLYLSNNTSAIHRDFVTHICVS